MHTGAGAATPPGIRREQGGIIRTSLTGHTYTTTPGGAIFFPQLALPTGELLIPNTEARRKHEAWLAANYTPPPF
jgi:hypothetical protein